MATHDSDHSASQVVVKVAAAVIGLLVLATAVWALEWVSNNPGVTVVAALVVAAAALWGAAYLRLVSKIVGWTVKAGCSARRWVGRWPLGVRRFSAAILALGLVGTGIALVWAVVIGEPAVARTCPHPRQLRVLTSIDGLEPTRELARRYERWTAGSGHGGPSCPRVRVFVYASPTPISALANSWRDGGGLQPLVSVGPRPDVWLPDSSAEVHEVGQWVKRSQLPMPLMESDVRSIGSSPLVLVTRLPVSGSVAAASTWPRLLSGVRRGSAPALLVADPESSSAGLLGVSGHLRDAKGRLVPLAEARKRVRTLVAANSGTPLLCHWAAAAGTTAPESVVVSDQAWRRFVAGAPESACPGGQVSTSGTRIAPADAPVLDHPFVEFAWSTPAQRKVVDQFQSWLDGIDGRDALDAIGLGAVRPDCSGLKDNACVPSELGVARDLYQEAQVPGRVLLAMDASGSMAEQVDRAGTTRFQIASRVVGQALGQMGPKDQFGLWTFPGSDGRGQRRLVGIAEGDAQHREATRNALRTVRPAGGTPLYDTILAGMKAAAKPDTEVDPRALVVLTDGHDTTSSKPAHEVRREVHDITRATGVQLHVIATGQASCTGPHGLQDLAKAGQGQCLDATADQLDGVVARLFDGLWKGQ